MEAFSRPARLHRIAHPRHHLPLFVSLIQDFLSVTEVAVHRLDTSSSGSQHPVMVTEQPVTQRTQTMVVSLARKLKWKLLDVSQGLCKDFRRPRLLKEAPSHRQSIRAALNLNRSCESLPAGCISSIP